MTLSPENGTFVELDAEALDEALEDLEKAMKAGESTLNHEKVRPSAVAMAHSARDAYKKLIDAHPDYQLTEGDGGD